MPLSYTQLQRYRTCPRMYEFAHVKKIPWGVSLGESFGAAIHATLKKWGEEERRGLGLGLGLGNEVDERQIALFQEEKPLESVTLTEERLMGLWRDTFSIDAYPTRAEADFARMRGERILKGFFTWWQRETRNVDAVEKAFSIVVAGTAFAGRLDRIEQTDTGIRIIDFKTSGVVSQEEADADLQLSLYALAALEMYEGAESELVLLFLTEDGCVERVTGRNASQRKDAARQIELIVERLTSKDFRPQPKKETCMRCPYRGVCGAAVK